MGIPAYVRTWDSVERNNRIFDQLHEFKEKIEDKSRRQVGMAQVPSLHFLHGKPKKRWHYRRPTGKAGGNQGLDAVSISPSSRKSSIDVLKRS